MPEYVTLDSDSSTIQYLCKKDKRLAKVISIIGPISYKIKDDPFAFLVHEILEQMLSTKASAKIYERLEKVCNNNVTPEVIWQLTEDQIKNIGTSSFKVSYIKGLAQAVLSGNLKFSELDALDDNEVIEKLTSLKGVGEWTANMYLIFVLDRPDVLPITDVAFLQAFQWLYNLNDRTPETIITKCKKWKPYSSIASRYLYRALDMGLTKKKFSLYG